MQENLQETEVVESDNEVVEPVITIRSVTENDHILSDEKLDKMLTDSEKSLQRIKELEEQNSVLSAQILADAQAQAEQAFNSALDIANLSVFKGIENINTLPIDEQVAFLQNAVNEILVQHSYQPKDVAQQEAYTEALQQGDVKKALDFKFSRLFGKK